MTLGWFPLVLIYIITNSISKILQKIAVKKEDIDPKAFTVAFFFFGGLLAVPFILTEPIILPPDYRGWLALTVACFAAALYMSLYYHSLKEIEVSQTETIATTRSIWAMVLGVIFFHETISASKVIGVILIMAAIASIYWYKGEFTSFKRPHWMVVVYAFMISVGYALDKYSLCFFSLMLYQVLIYTGSGIITLIYFPGTWKKMMPFIKWNSNTPIFTLCFIMQVISSLAIFRAYQVGGALSVVGPMAQTTTLVTIMAGVIFLQERWNLSRKLIGIAIAVAGIAFLRFINF